MVPHAWPGLRGGPARRRRSTRRSAAGGRARRRSGRACLLLGRSSEVPFGAVACFGSGPLVIGESACAVAGGGGVFGGFAEPVAPGGVPVGWQPGAASARAHPPRGMSPEARRAVPRTSQGRWSTRQAGTGTRPPVRADRSSAAANSPRPSGPGSALVSGTPIRPPGSPPRPRRDPTPAGTRTPQSRRPSFPPTGARSLPRGGRRGRATSTGSCRTSAGRHRRRRGRTRAPAAPRASPCRGRHRRPTQCRRPAGRAW